MDTNVKLDKLQELETTIEVVNAHFDEVKSQVPVPELPPEIQQQLDKIESERAVALEQLQKDIENLTAEIKDDVLKIGSTVKGEFKMAVYNKGRESWDGKLLNGYAVAHPEILAAKSIGNPSVTIRKK